jgi:predicted transcriptional regulator
MRMQRRRPTIGDRELDLLRWIESRGEASVGEAADGFGGEHGLARSTVLTMMERLRAKGHLERHGAAGGYRYRVAVPARELARTAVARFVEGTLGGSLSPFVAYLAEHESLDARERAEVEALLERLRARDAAEEDDSAGAKESGS